MHDLAADVTNPFAVAIVVVDDTAVSVPDPITGLGGIFSAANALLGSAVLALEQFLEVVAAVLAQVAAELLNRGQHVLRADHAVHLFDPVIQRLALESPFRDKLSDVLDDRGLITHVAQACCAVDRRHAGIDVAKDAVGAEDAIAHVSVVVTQKITDGDVLGPFLAHRHDHIQRQVLQGLARHVTHHHAVLHAAEVNVAVLEGAHVQCQCLNRGGTAHARFVDDRRAERLGNRVVLGCPTRIRAVLAWLEHVSGIAVGILNDEYRIQRLRVIGVAELLDNIAPVGANPFDHILQFVRVDRPLDVEGLLSLPAGLEDQPAFLHCLDLVDAMFEEGFDGFAFAYIRPLLDLGLVQGLAILIERIVELAGVDLAGGMKRLVAELGVAAAGSVPVFLGPKRVHVVGSGQRFL